MPDPARRRPGQHQRLHDQPDQGIPLRVHAGRSHASTSRPIVVETSAVPRARFNYNTRRGRRRVYYLPRLGEDFVLLTPIDMLTRDDTWINYGDMISKFRRLPEALPNDQQRAQINDYFQRTLGDDPDAAQIRAAIAATIRRFPELIDRYIRLKEDNGDRAKAISADKVEETERALVEQIQQALAQLAAHTEFYDKPWTSYEECLDRARYFKAYIEDNDGYKLLQPRWAAVLQREGAAARVRARLVRHRVRRQPRGQQRPRSRRLQGQLRRRRQVADRVQAGEQQGPQAQPREAGQDLRGGQPDAHVGQGHRLLYRPGRAQGGEATARPSPRRRGVDCSRRRALGQQTFGIDRLISQVGGVYPIGEPGRAGTRGDLPVVFLSG